MTGNLLHYLWKVVREKAWASGAGGVSPTTAIRRELPGNYGGTVLNKTVLIEQLWKGRRGRMLICNWEMNWMTEERDRERERESTTTR